MTQNVADPRYARARRAIFAVLASVTLLLATHLGEFWPFSIYPMFSRAGRPFTRAIVRELAPSGALPSGPYTPATLPGRAFGLVATGIDQSDVANIVSKTTHWTPQRLQALQRLFADPVRTRRLLVLAATGELDPDGHDVRLLYHAVAELTLAGPRLLNDGWR
jgi:hypothetical protein